MARELVMTTARAVPSGARLIRQMRPVRRFGSLA